MSYLSHFQFYFNIDALLTLQNFILCVLTVVLLQIEVLLFTNEHLSFVVKRYTSYA